MEKSMYGLKLRLLASAFLDAQSVTMNSDDIAELQRRFKNPNLMPVPIQEQSLSGVNTRIGFITPNGEWRIVLLGSRFDVSWHPVVQLEEKKQEPSFEEFCTIASRYLISMLEHYNRSSHRIAAIQEGLLPEQPKEEMDKIAVHLLNLTPTFRDDNMVEWDYRVAARTSREFGVKEPTNTIVTVKRLVGKMSMGQDSGKDFDRIQVNLDVNTVPENVKARFGSQQIKAFFSQAPMWHSELEQEISDHISKGLTEAN